MSRKSKELILLVVIAAIFTWLDPVSITGGGQAGGIVFGFIAYAVPAAVLTVILSRVFYSLKKS